MTDRGPGEGREEAAKTLAAVMAAVQAYLDAERPAPAKAARTLSPWKTAQWTILRGVSRQHWNPEPSL